MWKRESTSLCHARKYTYIYQGKLSNLVLTKHDSLATYWAILEIDPNLSKHIPFDCARFKYVIANKTQRAICRIRYKPNWQFWILV